ncbi:MAG: type II secretion system protein [Minisyncoccia bacterium]
MNTHPMFGSGPRHSYGAGFTLIELLVVIAIIGVLATTVLASMSGAKRTGNDAAVKANLATAQTQGSLYYSIANTYGASNPMGSGSCTKDGTLFTDSTTVVDDVVQHAITDATKNAIDNDVKCKSSATAFLIAGKLTDGAYWCVDSHGAAVSVAGGTNLSSLTYCPQ